MFQVSPREVTDERHDTHPSYDRAFGLFFAKLAGIGITPRNTLFVLTTDEGDRLSRQGLKNYGLAGWLQHEATGIGPDLRIVGGCAASIFLPPRLRLMSTLAALRTVPGVRFIAGTTGMAAIHTAGSSDPRMRPRLPQFLLFARPDTWWIGSDSATGSLDRELSMDTRKWAHGTVGRDMNTTWLALIGPGDIPGVLHQFVDLVDADPTMDFLLGYSIPAWLDGRVLFEALVASILPSNVTADNASLRQIADTYK